MEKQIAFITGATRGIGKAIALTLAQQGAAVVGTATSQAGADKISAYFEEHSLNGKGTVLNVTDKASIEAAVAFTQEHFGHANILVNNAAITRDNLMLRMKDDEWNSIINTNLSAVYHVCKAHIKSMVKNRDGKIINITSVVGVTGNAGQANYAAAKAGVIGLTKSLANEIATRGVTVNCVAPGFIDTDMTRGLGEEIREAILKNIPMGRLGKPDDIAAMVGFLASPAAAYITGQTLHVNGGMYMA